jgi:ParB family chromosome partitioning protein
MTDNNRAEDGHRHGDQTMNKLLSFLSKNEAQMREDCGERPAGFAPPLTSKLDGRIRLSNAAAIAVDRITADAQTREIFEESSLQRLAASLKEYGQLQPIRVRWDEQRGLYVIIAGERRWRAARLAGLPTIDCVVAEGLDAATILCEQVIENALREDLQPIERARAFKCVMDQNGWTHTQLAEQLHIHQGTVSRSIALLDLDSDTQHAVDAGELTASAAIRRLQASSNDRAKAPARKGKPARERTLRTSLGWVALRGRKNLTGDDVRRMLAEASAAAESLDVLQLHVPDGERRAA